MRTPDPCTSRHGRRARRRLENRASLRLPGLTTSPAPARACAISEPTPTAGNRPRTLECGPRRSQRGQAEGTVVRFLSQIAVGLPGADAESLHRDPLSVAQDRAASDEPIVVEQCCRGELHHDAAYSTRPRLQSPDNLRGLPLHRHAMLVLDPPPSGRDPSAR